MKQRILLILLIYILIFPVTAQKIDYQQAIKDEVWANSASEFKLREVPNKWRKESAVILGYLLDYSCSYKKEFEEKILLRMRIKLLDKNAVEEFSQLSFDKKFASAQILKKNSNYAIIGAKTVKPDGTEKEVDLTKAVTADVSNSDLKIAIPSLETGDILDYFITVKDKSTYLNLYAENEILSEKYPVVEKTMRFTIPFRCNFSSASFNGAPEFKEKLYGKAMTYTLKDTMRQKAPDIFLSYPHRTMPEVRYLLYDRNYHSIPDPKKKVTRDARNLLNYIAYSKPKHKLDIGFIIDFLKGNFPKEKDQAKIVKELYYLLRNPLYLKAYFNIEQGHPLEYETVSNRYYNLMNLALRKYRISHQLMVTPSRTYGPLSDQVSLSSSADIIIKPNTTPALYLYRPTPFSIPGEFPYVFEGMAPVAKEFTRKGSVMDTESLPVSSMKDNRTITVLNINLDPEDPSKMTVKRSVEAVGHNKIYHQFLIFTDYDYLKEYDLPKYQIHKSHLMKSLVKQYNAEKEKFEQRKTQDYFERDKRIKKAIERDLNVSVKEYKNLQIKSIGMWDTAPKVIYSDKFVIENMVRKAGPNLIIEFGKLIDEQTKPSDEQRTRNEDIYMNYARSFEHIIELTIPAGYEAEGIENLNKKFENEQGGFIASAKTEGNKLIVRTRKFYKTNYAPASEWSKFLEFLDQAVEFNNLKILLKRIPVAGK